MLDQERAAGQTPLATGAPPARLPGAAGPRIDGERPEFGLSCQRVGVLRNSSEFLKTRKPLTWHCRQRDTGVTEETVPCENTFLQNLRTSNADEKTRHIQHRRAAPRGGGRHHRCRARKHAAQPRAVEVLDARAEPLSGLSPPDRIRPARRHPPDSAGTGHPGARRRVASSTAVARCTATRQRFLEERPTAVASVQTRPTGTSSSCPTRTATRRGRHPRRFGAADARQPRTRRREHTRRITTVHLGQRTTRASRRSPARRSPDRGVLRARSRTKTTRARTRSTS